MNEFEGKFCPRPWDFIVIDSSRVRACCWSDVATTYKSGDDIFKVWNHEIFKEFRRRVLNSDYSLCKKEYCFALNNKNSCQNGHSLYSFEDMVKMDPYFKDIIENKKTDSESLPALIQLDIDSRCNLSCPICRDQKVLTIKKEDREKYKKIIWDIYERACNQKRPLILSMTSCGEAFFSDLYREFLFSIDLTDKPHIGLGFNTNGTCLNEETWKKMSKIEKNIKNMLVSIDGHNKEVYEKTRTGGNFDVLVENLKYMYKKREELNYSFYLTLVCTISSLNYSIINSYVEFFRSFLPGVPIMFNRFIRYPHLTKIDQLDIFDTKHPLHSDMLKEFSKINPVELEKNNVFLGSIKNYINSEL